MKREHKHASFAQGHLNVQIAVHHDMMIKWCQAIACLAKCMQHAIADDAEQVCSPVIPRSRYTSHTVFQQHAVNN